MHLGWKKMVWYHCDIFRLESECCAFHIRSIAYWNVSHSNQITVQWTYYWIHVNMIKCCKQICIFYLPQRFGLRSFISFWSLVLLFLNWSHISHRLVLSASNWFLSLLQLFLSFFTSVERETTKQHATCHCITMVPI